MSVPDRSDKKAFAEYAAGVMKGWVEGRALEYRPKQQPDSPWSPAAPLWAWNLEDYRLAPEPPSVTPWTFETAPCERLKVKHKTSGIVGVAVVFPEGFAFFRSYDADDSGSYTFAEFAEQFEQLNGEPCGVKVEAEWPRWYRAEACNHIYRVDSQSDTVAHWHCFAGRNKGSTGTSNLLPKSFADPRTGWKQITAAEAAELLEGAAK